MAERVTVDIVVRAVDEATGSLRSIADAVEDNVSRFDRLKGSVSRLYDAFSSAVDIGMTIYNFMQSLENANIRVELAMNRVEDQQRRVARLQEELASITSNLTIAQEKLASLESERSILLDRLAAAQEQLNARKREYQDALARVSELQELVRQKEIELKEAKTVHRSETELVKQKEIELAWARSMLSEATGEAKRIADLLRQSEKEVRDIQSELDANTKALASTHSFIASQTEARRRKEEDLRAAEEDLRLAQERLANMQNNLASLYMTFALTTIPSVVGGIFNLVSSISGAGGLMHTLTTVSGLISTSVIPLLANPLTLAIVGVASAVATLYLAWQNNWLGIRDTTSSIVSWLQSNLASFISSVISGWESFTSTLSSIWIAMADRLKSIWDSTVGAILNAIRGFIDTVKEAFESMFRWLIGGSIWIDLCRGIVDAWNSIVTPLADAIRGFCGIVVREFDSMRRSAEAIWGDLVGRAQSAAAGVMNAIGSAVSSATSALQSFVGSVANAMSNAWNSIQNFTSSVCFAHAIREAVDSAKRDLDRFVDTVSESMGRAGGEDKVLGIGLAGAGRVPMDGVPYPPVAASVVVNVNAPLVNVEGSADRQTAELAASLVAEKLKTVLIEKSSSAAPTSRIRIARMVI